MGASHPSASFGLPDRVTGPLLAANAAPLDDSDDFDPDFEQEVATPRPTKAHKKALLILGTYDFENQSLAQPKLPGLNKIDPRKLVEWTKAWAPDTRSARALNKVTSQIRHVTFENFRDCLSNCLKHLPAPLEDSISISLVEPGKSQAWVNEIAIFQLGWKVNHYLALGEQGADRFEYSMKMAPDTVWQNPLSIYILDDGSYSGTQMLGNLNSVARFLTKVNIKFRLTAVVPFITNTAREKIQAAISTYPKGSVNLVIGEIIQTAGEVIRKACPKPADQRAVTRALWPDSSEGAVSSYMERNGLLYFEHKIPNSMSFPIGLAEGRTPEKENHPFIPATHPPYRPLEDTAATADTAGAADQSH